MLAAGLVELLVDADVELLHLVSGLRLVGGNREEVLGQVALQLLTEDVHVELAEDLQHDHRRLLGRALDVGDVLVDLVVGVAHGLEHLVAHGDAHRVELGVDPLQLAPCLVRQLVQLEVWGLVILLGLLGVASGCLGPLLLQKELVQVLGLGRARLGHLQVGLAGEARRRRLAIALGRVGIVAVALAQALLVSPDVIHAGVRREVHDLGLTRSQPPEAALRKRSNALYWERGGFVVHG